MIKILIPLIAMLGIFLLIACGTETNQSDFDFGNNYVSGNYYSSDDLSSSSGVYMSSSDQNIDNDEEEKPIDINDPDISSSSLSLSSEVENSSSSLSSIPNESSSSLSSSSIYDYSYLFDPDSCVGLLCDIIDPGELGVKYGVPAPLVDVNGTFTNPTIISGTQTPVVENLALLGSIKSFSWSFTEYISSGSTNEGNQIQGSYEWQVVANWDTTQTTYGGQVQIKDCTHEFVKNGTLTISRSGTIMDGTFLLSYADGVLTFVDPYGRFAIEWRP